MDAELVAHLAAANRQLKKLRREATQALGVVAETQEVIDRILNSHTPGGTANGGIREDQGDGSDTSPRWPRRSFPERCSASGSK